MAAGQGFKTFVTGEVLTSGDVNGYLMQGINVFTNATARDAAITAPAEGQFAFTKDNNSLWYYDGAAWVASGGTGDIEGVTAGIGVSGGGTSGTVTVTNSMATAIDAKGDLVPGTGADTFSRLAVGANGTVLTADSAEATGLKWATGGAPETAYTLLTSSTTTGTSAVTLTFSACSDLLFQVIQTSNDGIIDITFNGDTTAKYDDFKAALSQSGGSGFSMTTANNAIRTTASRNSSETGFAMIVNGAKKAGSPTFYGQSYFSDGGGTRFTRSINGIYTGNGPITSITITNAAGTTFSAMTTKVYGRA